MKDGSSSETHAWTVDIGNRRGTDQQRVWSEIARNNAALKAENETGSLERALKSRPVQDKLGEVRRSIVPNVPEGTMGFIFVDRGRAVGAEFFGRTGLAAELLPKLLDSYAWCPHFVANRFAGEPTSSTSTFSNTRPSPRVKGCGPSVINTSATSSRNRSTNSSST